MDGFTRGAAAVIGPQTERMLAAGEQVLLQISGDSMRPTLKPRRDAALLAPLTSWPPKRGAILFFRSERSASGYALHRAVRVNGDRLTMNGDAQIWTEEISREAVLAHAIALFRKGKPISVDGFLYRAYVAFWGLTRPVRHAAFAVWRKIKTLRGPGK